jgi:hypothetical protein
VYKYLNLYHVSKKEIAWVVSSAVSAEGDERAPIFGSWPISALKKSRKHGKAGWPLAEEPSGAFYFKVNQPEQLGTTPFFIKIVIDRRLGKKSHVENPVVTELGNMTMVKVLSANKGISAIEFVVTWF